MLVQPAAVELLAALSPVLARWGRWYVFGAQGVTAYGVPRLSADVDVTLALHPDAPDRFARDMGGGRLRSPRERPQVLPDVFARDAERLARFEREAKTLASLNHPKYCADLRL